jgi:hypothetical protein
MKSLLLMRLNPQTTFYGLLPFLGGVLSVLDGVAVLLHVNVPGVTVVGDPGQLILNGLIAASAGMAAFAAKDAGTHSTISQVEQASVEATAKAVTK